MTQDNPAFDLVVFGATGFVGQLVCHYLHTHLQQDEADFSWAIAGRSADKLNRLAAKFDSSTKRPACITADARDEASLRVLCAQTQVVISTVGPYALYGELLVKVCAETGTDYCDLTGEPQWVRRMIQCYESLAQTSGAHIVHCCGFDSVPSDVGVYYLQHQAQQQFGEPCIAVKMRLQDAQGGISGGTAASGINLVKEAMEDAALRQELANPFSLCPDTAISDHHPQTMIPVQFDRDFQQWVTPFVMAAINTRIVLRSNYLQQSAYGSTFQYEEGILVPDGPIGWAVAQGLKLGMDALVLGAALPPTRWLLEQTVVPASGTGPNPEQQRNGFYDLRFVGRTVSGAMMQIKVTGDRDPGYGSTSKILSQAGLCLAQDVPAMNADGGFWTPASLMGTSLIHRLQQYAGLTFEVVDVVGTKLTV
jgi:short subunit dehydrogenase-like uncharacterized protein